MNDMRYSSSHIDVCHIVEQILTAWERIDISDLGLKLDYTKQLVELLCEIVTIYTQKVKINFIQVPQMFSSDN